MELVSAFVFASITGEETELALSNKRSQLRRKRDLKQSQKAAKAENAISTGTSKNNSIRNRMEQILYHRFNNTILEDLLRLPCFPLLSAYLAKFETDLMCEFERDVGFCRY